jgi:glucose/arabinose dehydrogenase
MKQVVAFLIMLSVIFSSAFGQLVQKKVIVPPQFQSFIDTNKTVMIPDEYEINVFYAGSLKRPRFMALGPKNTIYVADMNANHILALPDGNYDGIADSAVIVAPDVDSAHSLAFYNGALYVAQPSRVRKFLDKNGDGFYETEEPFISGIGDTGYYNHYTRTILFDTIGNHIYLSVGASCDDCREGDSERAAILEFNLDGSGRTVYATGLRNALGLAVNPTDHSLWAANADRDFLGTDLPQEVITSVHKGDFFGWPFAYGYRQWEDFQSTENHALLPLTSADSAKVNTMRIADIFIPAHSTPMGILFYHDPRTYIQAPPLAAFVAVHGSSSGGRKIGLGYKVIKLVFDEHLLSWNVSDFLTGFLTDSINYSYWGRPCGLVQDSSGDIYLSSDVGIPAIYRIHLKDASAVRNPNAAQTTLSVFPNPASSSITIAYSLAHSQFIKFELIDQLGRVMQLIHEGSEESGEKSISVVLKAFPTGIYYLRMQSEEGTLVRKIVIEK